MVTVHGNHAAMVDALKSFFARQRIVRIDALYGPRMVEQRALILSALTENKITKSNPAAGWHRFVSCLREQFSAPGGCNAERERSLDAAIAEAIGRPGENQWRPPQVD
jgi:hypothetical protein